MNEEILLEVKPKYIWWLRALSKVINPVFCVTFFSFSLKADKLEKKSLGINGNERMYLEEKIIASS